MNIALQVILQALGLVAAAAFSWWLWKSASRNVESAANGRFHLRVHWIYVVLGFLGFALGAIGLAVLIATPSKSVIQLVFPITGAVVFWGSGLPCVLYYRNHMVWFDNTSITVSDVWGNLKTTSWNALRSIELRKYSGLLRITLDDGSHLNMSPHLVGLNQFLGKLEEKTDLIAPEIGWKPM